ncbi:MAG: FAD-dependent oxidoreductase [Peptococcaceae bacterium]|nr:FAD-dependent oxidoreductase [Peptococcaceae bacterium]MDH7526355.1 FAD-dependent oxidoreductase [Peptococcaceae bacterium]
MEYCIVGNSAAAIGAVEGIRKRDKTGRITVVSAEIYHTYSRPLISYYLAGKVKIDKMYYRPLGFYEHNGIRFIGGKPAAALDTKGRKVVLACGDEIPYDRLLVATGGKPFVPAIDGLDKKNIFTFHKLDDVKAIEKALDGRARAIIIGAGLIGMKAAEALSCLGAEVIVVELANRVLSSILDEQAGALVRDVMENHGIRFVFENTVKRVLGEERVTGVELADGNRLECDLLIVAIGVIPNTDLVKNSPVPVNRGIVVNKKMETGLPGIYAAGDVAEGDDAVLGVRRVIPILPNAYRQGEIAGLNMAGDEAAFSGGFAMNAIGFFGYSIATAGVPGGPDYEELAVLDPDERTYRKIVLKNNRLVGFIAMKDINRIGMLTGLIQEGTNVGSFKEKLVKTDFGYLDWPCELRRERVLAGGGL